MSIQGVYFKYYYHDINYNSIYKRNWPEIRRLHKTHTVSEIAKKLKKSCSWVHIVMRKLKLKPLLSGKRRAAAMGYLSHRGYSTADIADELNCTTGDITYYKRRYNVIIHSRVMRL